MAHARRFDHVGITVNDLDLVTDFFVGLGLEVEGRASLEGEFVDTVCGMSGVRTQVVMLKAPNESGRLEIATFVHPDTTPGSPDAMPTELGLRNVSFEVENVQAAVDYAAGKGYGLVGGIGQYEDQWKLAYIRGPEGLIVSVAERLG